MPKILLNDKKLQKYRIYFVSFDCSEKMHVHIEYENERAKIWVEYHEETAATTLITHSSTFSNKHLNIITKALIHHGKTINDQWKEHCGNYRPPQ